MSKKKPKKALVRFRADPEMIRVSIRKVHHDDGWMVFIETRDPGDYASYTDIDPVKAIEGAVAAATESKSRWGGWDGLDPDMEYTYDHPWKTE